MLIAHFIDETGRTPQFRVGPFEQEFVAELCGIAVAEVHRIAHDCGYYNIGPHDFLTGRQCVRIIQEARGHG